jgi:hypothetical protein
VFFSSNNTSIDLFIGKFLTLNFSKGLKSKKYFDDEIEIDHGPGLFQTELYNPISPLAKAQGQLNDPRRNAHSCR